MVVAAAGAAGDDGGKHVRGGRSSDVNRSDAARHGRSNGWLLRPRGDALSAVTCLVWTEAGQNDDGNMVGAGEVSVSTEMRARAQISARE